MTRGMGMVLSALIGAGLVLAGCSTEVVGSDSSSLTWVEKAEFENQVMYMDLAVSTKPMTELEIGDTSFATPVRMGFYEGVAVAWFSPDGELYEDREHFVGAWPIHGDAMDADGTGAEAGDINHNVDPTSDGITEIEPGTEDPVQGYNFATLVAPEERTLENTGLTLPKNSLPFAFLDFAEFLPEVELVIDIHPGCL